MIRHLAALALLSAGAFAQSVPRWSRFEARLQSATDYKNPLQDVSLTVAFQSPSGKTHILFAFWDGGRNWRVRFSPDELGKWTWRSGAEPPDFGLHNKTGGFDCTAPAGTRDIERRGPIRVASDGFHFEHTDGTPFFWLGDTVWNGALLSDARDWKVFLEDRAAKGFNVIQFVTTQWSAAHGDAAGRVAYTGKEKIAIDPVFFQRLDERVDAINAHGLLAAPVLLWAHPSQPDLNPGVALPENQMTLLARYLVARYGAYHVVWMLNGDGDYTGENAAKWKRIGRAVFSNPHPNRLATMHPGRLRWHTPEYLSEPWYSFQGYQSGHRDDAMHLNWLTHEGPVAKDWRNDKHIPTLNIEPNYEGHRSRSAEATNTFTAYDVRRAAYWSLLTAPPAGITYGGHGIWSWETRTAEPLHHPGIGLASPWHEAMHLPGSTHMKHLAALMRSLPWHKLRPAQDVLVNQPGERDPTRWVAAAAPEDRSFLLAYVPAGSALILKPAVIQALPRMRWFDPRTGIWRDATSFEPPDNEDWLIQLTAK